MKPKIKLLLTAAGLAVLLGAPSARAATSITNGTSGAGGAAITNQWVVPAGIYSVKVEMWGGGAAGGGINFNNTGGSTGGGGGGGGGAYTVTTLAVTPGTTNTIVVGNGAVGANGTGSGANGGDSTFPGATTATGGSGQGNGGAASPGGAGGTVAGAGNFNGGPGAKSNVNGSGGGGGSGSSSTNGNATAGATTTNTITTVGGSAGPGGGAGATGVTNNAVGGAGSYPGGGGSGAFDLASTGNRKGGNGGNGQVILTFPADTGLPDIWVGNINGAWDNGITTNWVDLNFAPTVFTNGNSVSFKDSASNFTVNISGTVQTGGITVTNAVNNYTFSGGTIGGTGGLAKQGTGTLTLTNVGLAYTGSTVVNGGTLAIASAADNTLAGGISGSGNLTKSGAGTLTLAGTNTFNGLATVTAGTLAIDNNATNNASYQVTGGTLAVNKATRGVTLTISNLTFGAGATGLSLNDWALSSLSPEIRAPNFTNAGTVTVSYTATNIAPGAIVLIDYDTATSVLGSFAAPSLPAGYTGMIVTNVANSSIDLVITGTPAKQWVGGDSNGPNGWDVADYANWSGGTQFTNGDYVSFLDGTSYTNIDVATVAPALMVVSNSATTYTFNNGSGITTPLLVKDGSGTVSLANPGNSITNINLRAGTLSFDSTATYASTITGGGTLRVGGSAVTVTLSGNNSGFYGPIIVTNASTLTLGANNVLGTGNTTTIDGGTVNNGAVLNINAKQNQGVEIIVSGNGNGLGAIVNNAGTQNNALSRVTLAGDTTFGGTGRWEIQGSGGSNAVLKANGAYNLTKTAANYFALVNVDVDPLLGDINVNQGTFQIAVTTSTNASLGNVNNTINLSNGTTLDLYNSNAGFVPAWNKQIALGGGSVLIENTGTRSTAFLGPVNLGGNTLTLSGSAALTFSNALSGGGNVVKTGANAISLLGANNYNSTTVSNGSLTLSTASTVSGGCTVNDSATLGAQRTSSGGTLSMSSLTLGSTGAGAVTLQFDLAAYGVSANPVMDVSSGTLTTNAAIYNVTVLADLTGLTPGTFPLLKYASGAFTNAIATVNLPAGVVGTVTNNTAASRVELTVVSAVRNLTWVGNMDSNWNIAGTANWVQTGTTNATVYKEVGAGDNVVFDSSASNYTVNVAATVSPSSMQINGTNNYAIGGAFSIAGPVQVDVNVSATNTVTLTGVNTHTGGTHFDLGTTIVTSDAALGNATNLMRWSGGAVHYTGSATNVRPLSVESGLCGVIVDTNQTVELGGVQNFTGGTAAYLDKSGPGTLRLTGSGTQRLLVDQGTAIVAGNAAITNAGGANSSVSGTNGIATLIFKDTAAYVNTNQLNIGDGTGLTNATRILGEMYVTNNAVLTLANLYVGQSLTATGRVYQSGGQVTTTNAAAGTWSLGGSTAADTNAFGGYYLSGGALNITNQSFTVGQWGHGELVVSGSGTLTAANLNLGTQNSASSVGTVTVNGGTVTVSANLRVPWVGNSGTAVITNGGNLTANALLLGTAANANTGSVTVGSGGTLTVGKVSGSATTQNITFNNGTLKASASSATYMQGLTSATIASGGLTNDTAGYSITINQNLTGGGGLTKAGAGTLTLTNQSYTGDTVVNAGTLAGIAGISGTVLRGNLIVTAGGTLSPGGSSLGVIYAANGKNVTLGGTNLFQIARSGFNLNEDQVQADGNITNGGTLTVTFDNTTDITALSVGDTFPFLLQGGSLLGAFSSVNLPTVDPVNGNVLTWNTNSLATGGSISVASTTSPFTPPTPTNITYTVTSGQMVLGWPNGLGWLLQGQTNPLSVGLRSQTNWMNVTTNSPYTNLFAAPTVFYRLIYTNTP